MKNHHISLRWVFFFALCFTALSPWANADEPSKKSDIKNATSKGKLLIVGGALSSENDEVYRAFIDALPEKNGVIGIIPAASGSPHKSAQNFKQDLMYYGVAEKNIVIIPIAVKDDASTADIDESQWRNNGNNTKIAEAISAISGFWFTGGDQMRIIDTLLAKKNRPTKVYKALRQRLQEGAVIGGSSAGAAMMSQPMIAAGDSYTAITKASSRHYKGLPSQAKGQLYLHHGLGFFPYGITDQHFDRRARLGRLIKALADTGIAQGYAVDENTGILVDLSKHSFHVLGSGTATIVDITSAHFQRKPFSATNISVSILAQGDRYAIASQNVSIDSAPPSVLTREYNDREVHHGAGDALGGGRLSELLGSELLDNRGTKELRRYNFIEQHRGFVYRFYQVDSSDAFWRYSEGTREQYTIVDVRLDIKPITIALETL